MNNDKKSILDKNSLIKVSPNFLLREDSDDQILVTILDNGLDFFELKGVEARLLKKLYEHKNIGLSLSELFRFLINESLMSNDEISSFLSVFIHKINSYYLINIS